MKLAILGSQNFSKFNLVENYIASLPKNEDIIILTLEVKGVHAVANWTAKKLRFPTIVIHVDWKEYGGRAFFISAAKLIEDCDELTVFFDEHDKGSRGLIEDAYAKYKLVRVVKENGVLTEVGQLFLNENKAEVIADDDIPF